MLLTNLVTVVGRMVALLKFETGQGGVPTGIPFGVIQDFWNTSDACSTLSPRSKILMTPRSS